MVLMTLLMLNATFFAVALLSSLTFQGGSWVCTCGRRFTQRYAAERHQAFAGCMRQPDPSPPSPAHAPPIASHEDLDDDADAAHMTPCEFRDASEFPYDNTTALSDSNKRTRSPSIDHDALFDELVMENKLCKSTVNHALRLCKKGLDLSKVRVEMLLAI